MFEEIRDWLTRNRLFVEFIKKIGKYVLTFVMFLALTLGIHEMAHLQVLRFFGGDGYIKLSMWGGAGVFFTKIPSYPQIVAFSGGLFVAGVYFLKMAMNLKDDYAEAYALIPLILNQLVYGILEGFFIFQWTRETFVSVTQTAGLITYIVGLLISIVLFVKRWVDDNY